MELLRIWSVGLDGVDWLFATMLRIVGGYVHSLGEWRW